MTKIKRIEPHYVTSMFLRIDDRFGNYIQIPLKELEIFREQMNKKIDEILTTTNHTKEA